MIRAYVDGLSEFFQHLQLGRRKLECDASFAFLIQPTVASYDNTGY